jgi:hypothetical protein
MKGSIRVKTFRPFFIDDCRLSQNRGGTPIDVRLALPGAAVAEPTANYRCVCRRFASDIFVGSFPFVPSVIRAEAALANASTGICLLQPGMEHRMKSVVTAQNRGLA